MADAQGIQVLFATYAVAFNKLFDKICDLEKAIKKLAGEGTWAITLISGGQLSAFGRVRTLPVDCFAVVINVTGSRVTEFGYGNVQDVIEGGWVAFGSPQSYLPKNPISFGGSIHLVPNYERFLDIGISNVAIGIPIGVTGNYFFAKRVFTPTPAPTPTP